MRIIQILFFITISLCFFLCKPKDRDKEVETTKMSNYPLAGSLEWLSDEMEQFFDKKARPELLAGGYAWTEGPLWIEAGNYLLFSEIPPNNIHKWKEGEGASLYLHPSGYTGPTERTGEPGSNGLVLSPEGKLVLCQHGDRRMAYMNAPLDDPSPEFVTIAHTFEGKRFNSPNDAAYHSSGELYFTDPPYGLQQRENDPDRELDFFGVFRVKTDGGVELLIDSLSRPNGIAFSPDEKLVYVANSDPKNAIWAIYEVNGDGRLENGRILLDMTHMVSERRGLPDGLKVHSSGYIFATGPGGVLVIHPDGRHIGTIETGKATSNCAFDASEKYLYMTANDMLMRIAIK
ncbi:MAG: SMP-30/gluconolactonase/LRE family protein [Cyclobacteriaceae bacterium]|nr:SMP-30/gluconolactonase/LRE family protein [Cyclobacteriaceae bacterium]